MVALAKGMPEREPWQVAGNAAEIYQRELVPAVFGPWAPRVVELAELRPGLRVLDVACGTGVVARLAAEAISVEGRVAGLDLNPDMLAVAATLPAVAGASIEWVEGSAQALPFGEASFDVVCCQLGLQFFPDREGALREMKRVLAPGGRVVVMVWGEIGRSPALPRSPRPSAGRSERTPRRSCAHRSRSATPARCRGCSRQPACATVRSAPRPGTSASPRRRGSSAATSAAHRSPPSSRPHRRSPTKTSCARSSAQSTRSSSRLAVLSDRGAARGLPRLTPDSALTQWKVRVAVA
jgi:SAM-dependent methyltransferase